MAIKEERPMLKYVYFKEPYSNDTKTEFTGNNCFHFGECISELRRTKVGIHDLVHSEW